MTARTLPRVLILVLSWAAADMAGGAGEAGEHSSPDVRVHGKPEFVVEHGRLELPGKYIKTVFLQLMQHQQQQTAVAIPVHDGEPADNIAADVFRRYGLPFDEQYIDVHNMIAAVQAGQDEDGIPDITQSKVDPHVAAAARKHPLLSALDLNSQILVDIAVQLLRARRSEGEEGAHTFTVRVMEGDLPAAAVTRWEREVGLEDGGEGWMKYGGSLTEKERNEILEVVSDRMADVLMHEDAIAARLRGWTAGGGGNDKRLEGGGAPWLARSMSPFDWESMQGTLLTSPLPPLSKANGTGSEENRLGGGDDSDDAAAQELIYRMQYPDVCHGRRAVVISMDGAVWGLAANIHYMTLLLNYCLLHNRTLITAKPYTTDIRDDIKPDYRKYLYKVDTSAESTLYFRNIDGPWLTKLNTPEYQLYVPQQFRHRGVLWWRSQLMRYVFRPKPFVNDYIEQRRAAIGLTRQGPGALIGLHVRHGDKSWDIVHQASYIGPLAPYLAKARSLCQRTGRTRRQQQQQEEGMQEGLLPEAGEGGDASIRCDQAKYFISTDDASVLSEARDQGLDALWDAEEARYNGSHVYATLGVSEKKWPGFPGNDEHVDTLMYALDSIKSIVLLSECSLFVGTATSCFSRLVLQLRVAAGLDDVPLALSSDWTVDSDPRYPAWPGWFADP